MKKESTCCHAPILEDFDRCSDCKEVNYGVEIEEEENEDEYIQQMADRFGGTI